MKVTRILAVGGQTINTLAKQTDFKKLAKYNRNDRRDAIMLKKQNKFNMFFIDLRNITL